MFRHIFLAVALLLSGCATPAQHQTASGKPEATMAAAPDRIKPLLIRDMTNQGWRMAKETQYDMTFEKPLEGPASILLASRYDPTPIGRISFSIFPQGNTTRVVADLAGVSNPGSAYERRTEMNNNRDATKVQDLLDIIAGEVARAPKS